ncbi:hypothetical protein P171DRAFT_49421 [Karstenula rhodostoma CBS 690.94]|uniref:Uncharacterized protein n=1 Tax=Karstenula rhodostoma CBS 690.94 TaxID=1392251 RepID=A0A9P4PH40_9PLEO|nr:hypothetical protein P171DRAFT_49421 [Karstenula rhodostoma CBS 690.94]
MSSSRNRKRKAAPTPSPESSQRSEGAMSPRKTQKTSTGRRRSGTSTATSSGRQSAGTENIDPHLLRLRNSVDANTPVVDRRHFIHAPDPTKSPESAKAFAAVVANRAPQPSRRPLACIDRSRVRPEVLFAIDKWVYHGPCKQDACIPGYIQYGGHPDTRTSAAISKQIKVHAWEWYKEENVVAPWKALSGEARDILELLGLSKDNFPVLPYTDDDRAQDPPVQARSRGNRAPGAALVPNQQPGSATTPAGGESVGARELSRNSEVVPDEWDLEDQATEENELEDTTSLADKLNRG